MSNPLAEKKKNRTLEMTVPMLDLGAQYKPLRKRIEAAISEVCESQHFVMGPAVAELEQRIADYSNARYGIGVSSGTDALLVALMALEVGPGDEVVTTPFTFFATGGVISRLGARPVFCDIDPETYNLDPDALRSFLTRSCRVESQQVINTNTGGRVRAIMPVHLFGQMADMSSISDLAREFGLRVVEDAAQAIGAESGSGRRAGSIGDIGCFSFFPSKNLGAFGDAGMCVTNDSGLAEKLRVLRVHGGKPKYYHALIGGNFRLDTIQAAILLVKLEYLDQWSSMRQKNARRYDRLFDSCRQHITVPVTLSDSRHVFNQYTLRVHDRDGLRAHLSAKGISTSIYYPVPLHLQECFRGLGYQAGDFPAAEEAARSAISIPIYPELTDDQQRYVVDACAEYYQTG